MIQPRFNNIKIDSLPICTLKRQSHESEYFQFNFLFASKIYALSLLTDIYLTVSTLTL